MAEDVIQPILRDLEADEELRDCFGENGPISSGLLNKMGALFEEQGIGLVEAFMKANRGEPRNDTCFQKLWEYVERINKLEVPRPVKRYLLKELDSLSR